VASDARLVLLHIVRKPDPGTEGAQERSHVDDTRALRWRQLAKAAHPGRVFVEVLEGDPARIIPVEAERFHSDAVLLDRSLETLAHQATARTTPLSPPPQGDVC
ncbi:MAG: universal stress protein, partial [bacterium]